VIGVLSMGGIQRRITARDLTLLDPLADQVSLAIERDQRATESVRTERLRSIGELSAGISHNLNNILTGVLVPAQMLKMTVDDPQVLELATMIISAGERASDLVQELYRSVKMTGVTHPLAPHRYHRLSNRPSRRVDRAGKTKPKRRECVLKSSSTWLNCQRLPPRPMACTAYAPT
jgi:K+-sensing histidine kinase KdpD